mgnify:CR=1 FL=1
MRTIILGREGNQPFKIKDDFKQVSRHHAEITIADDGKWSLKDTDSSYGTFIRDEESGDWIRVGNSQSITPMTFIKLGDERANSCSFFAKQVLDPGNFQKEHKYLRAKKKEFDEQQKKIEKFKELLNVGKIVLLVLCLALFALYMKVGSDNNDTTGGALIRMFLISVVPSALVQIIQMLYNPKKRMDDLKDKRLKFYLCPNPACGRRLTDEDIDAGACGKCGK